MSMFLKAIEKENAKHINNGGELAEITILKRRNIFTGDHSIKVSTCVDGDGCCHSVLKEFAKRTKQLQGE